MNTDFERIRQMLEEALTGNVLRDNRYGFRTTTPEGEERQYLFTTPVFHENGLVRRQFINAGTGFLFQGSKGLMTVLPDGVLLKNEECYVRLCWEKKQRFALSADGECLCSEEMEIRPTLNGVSVLQNYDRKPLYFRFESRPEYRGFARMNSKCFAYMKEKFVPYVTLNSVYAATGETGELSGADLAMIKDGDTRYRFRMTAAAENAQKLNWEINLYEPKLIQDTTVESRRPTENNAYGNVAFLGRSPDHGVQYLYSRFDFGKIKTDPTGKMKRVFLHIPYYAAGEQKFRVAAPFRRFCSFGSNWANKMPADDCDVKYYRQNGYFVFDLSDCLLRENGTWKENNGIVIYPEKSDGVSVLATADNYNMPQMIEIQYEKE